MTEFTADSSSSTCPDILKNFSGDWFVVYSNFPMWTKGKRRYPMFHYTIERREGKWGLADTVTYVRSKKKKHILGFDYLIDTDSFVWQGSGFLTKHLSSKWRVIHLDPNNEWALIYFEKTFFTPAGYDVIARDSLTSETKSTQITQILKDHSVPQLRKINQVHL
jgi:hypothetical protein